MKVLIIEDEVITAQSLQTLLQEVCPDCEVIALLPTVTASVDWFCAHPAPDVVFMDIHLGDGSAFAIFDEVQITCPIVFTTSYDEYAIKAFEVNATDYLLKPIDRQKLQHALDKIASNRAQGAAAQEIMLRNLLATMSPAAQATVYPRSLFVQRHDGLMPIAIKDIAFIMSDLKMAKIYMMDGTPHVVDQSLDSLIAKLDPKEFYRANRKFVVAHSAITNISYWFTGKLLLKLTVTPPENIIISRQSASDFKAWYLG